MAPKVKGTKEASDNCDKCEKAIAADNVLTCDSCKSNYHSVCQNISSEKLQILQSIPSAHWFCQNCDENSMSLVANIHVLTQRQDKLEANIEELSQKMQSKIETLSRLLDTKLEKINQRVDELPKNECTRMSYAAATQAGTNSNNKIQDQPYRFEVRLRGIPESAPDTKRVERLDYEKEQVIKVLNFIGAQASLTDIRRQGAYKKDKNKNLIIRFSTVFGVESVLHNAKNLPSTIPLCSLTDRDQLKI